MELGDTASHSEVIATVLDWLLDVATPRMSEITAPIGKARGVYSTIHHRFWICEACHGATHDDTLGEP